MFIHANETIENNQKFMDFEKTPAVSNKNHQFSLISKNLTISHSNHPETYDSKNPFISTARKKSY